MSTNAFNTSPSSSPEISDEGVAMTSEQKLIWGGGALLVAAFAFIAFQNMGDDSLKANVLSSTTTTPVEQIVEPKTEIVYKDQNGNILTDAQVEQILHPKKETKVLNVPENSSETQTSGKTKYPEISLTDAEKKASEEVKVDTSKKLFVKQEDAAKLLQEKRLVKKIVDNRPMYVEPISGAIVELIQPIVRTISQRNVMLPPPPPAAPVVFGATKTSSQETSRKMTVPSSFRTPSSSEIRR